MSRDEILALLRAHKPALVRRFGIVDLALFGPFARDSATAGSDIDILVRFDGPATLKRARVAFSRSTGAGLAAPSMS